MPSRVFRIVNGDGTFLWSHSSVVEFLWCCKIVRFCPRACYLRSFIYLCLIIVQSTLYPTLISKSHYIFKNATSAFSVKDATLIGWDHILDVNECIFSTMSFKHFKSLLNEVSKNESFTLRVLNLVANVGIVLFEQIHNWKDLTIVWHESFSNSITASNKWLQDFKSNCNNFWIASV